MDPREVFHKIFYVYILKSQIIVGCELVKPNYKPHIVTFVGIFLNSSYIFASFYTLATYDLDEKWKCLCCLPIAFQVTDLIF